jgi:hypothetical protein
LSLETTLAQTNDLLAGILAALQTRAAAAVEMAPAPAPTASKPERAVRATPAARALQAPAPVAVEPAPVAAPAPAPALVEEEPSIYWLIERHNTVYEQKPGDPTCTIQGAVQVDRSVYLAKKAEFEKNFNLAMAAKAEPAAAPIAAAPASSPTPAPSPAPTPAPAAASDEVPFSRVVEAVTALNRSDKPGHGRDGVIAILKRFLPGEEKPTVTKMQPLGRNAEIIAAVQALMAPVEQVEEAFDPLA